MSFYREILPFIDHVRSIRKLKNYLSFDMQFPSKWSIPKNYIEDGQVLSFEVEDTNLKGVSFVTQLDEDNISTTIGKIAKIIKLNKEREIKEKLFKHTIEQLRDTFEKTDLDKLKTLYFDFDNEESQLEIEDETQRENVTELAGEGESQG